MTKLSHQVDPAAVFPPVLCIKAVEGRKLIVLWAPGGDTTAPFSARSQPRQIGCNGVSIWDARLTFNFPIGKHIAEPALRPDNFGLRG